MPCKHEGGKGPCTVRFKSGECKKAHAVYAKANYRCAKTKATPSDAGEAGELFVAADLLVRGLPTTKPFNRNGKDDLHVRVRTGWKNVQVKLGRVHAKTGTIHLMRRNRITSDIVAVVDLTGKRVRYIANTSECLPEELT